MLTAVGQDESFISKCQKVNRLFLFIQPAERFAGFKKTKGRRNQDKHYLEGWLRGRKHRTANAAVRNGS